MKSKDYSLKDKFLIKEVSDLNELNGLRTVWNHLAERQGSHTPFLCFDWFETWLQHFLEDHKLQILIVYREDDIVAIAPFVIKNEEIKGILKAKKIELLGNAYSPIRDFISCDLMDEVKAHFTLNVVRYFFEVYKDWDILEFDSIPEENDAFKTIEDVVSNSAPKHRTYFCFGNWYLNKINYGFDHYFSHLPKAVRKDIQYCQRSLQKKGSLRFEIRRDISSFEHNSTLYDELREKSWKSPEKDRTFHREFEKIAAEKGWLRFGFLLHDDKPIASLKWIVCNRRAYILAVLYNQEYHKYSPGKILTSEMARWVLNEDKVVEIDFMRGDDPYKKDWTPNRRERKGITLFNNTARAQILAFLMTRALPIIARNQYLLAGKNWVSKYLKKNS